MDKRFVELVNDPDTTELAEGALLLAARADPTVDLENELARLGQLAGQCSEPTLDGVRRLLFRDLGFVGDGANYYDPANSLLPSVLDRRRGLPISLSVLMIEVGRRVGAPLDGVGMPGHFLVRDRVLPDVFVDPFHGGAVLDLDGVRRLFDRVTAGRLPFESRFVEPTPTGLILARMVANLVNAYRRLDQRADLLWAARWRSRCPDVGVDELVGLADAMAHAAAFDEAAALLDRVAEGLDADAADGLIIRAADLRSRMN